MDWKPAEDALITSTLLYRNAREVFEAAVTLNQEYVVSYNGVPAGLIRAAPDGTQEAQEGSGSTRHSLADFSQHGSALMRKLRGGMRIVAVDRGNVMAVIDPLDTEEFSKAITQMAPRYIASAARGEADLAAGRHGPIEDIAGELGIELGDA